MLASTPAAAQWSAANPAAAAAVRDPRVAAVLAEAMRMDAAIIAHDVAGFGSGFTDDAVVNNPFNRIARKADAERMLRSGMIDTAALSRSIEYAAVRGAHDVVLMGDETLTPADKAGVAGTPVHRRTTEVWTDTSGAWKLAVRQATTYTPH